MKKNIVHQKTRFLQDEKQKNIQGTLKVTGKHIVQSIHSIIDQFISH